MGTATTHDPSATPEPAAPAALGGGRSARVIVIGGGKGGTGKTLVTANLGVQLARRGERVAVIDADLGGANLHSAFGLDEPRRTLADLLQRRTDSVEDVAVPTGVPGLALVGGGLDQLDPPTPRYDERWRLVRHLRRLPFDSVVVDLGAGVHPYSLDLFLLADHPVLVLVPEPTAVENAYRFVKAAFWRRVRGVVAIGGLEPLVRTVLGEGSSRSPAEVIAGVSYRNPEGGRLLARQLELFRPRLVVNQARTPQDGRVGYAVAAAWRKFFGLQMDDLGAVPYDDAIWRSVRARRPVLVESPESAGARSFAVIADALLALEGELDVEILDVPAAEARP